MTSQRSAGIRTRILSAFILFLAALTVVIAFAAPAQQVSTRQPSSKSSAAAVPTQASTPGQTLLHALLPGDDAPFFLPPVIYDPHGFGFLNVSVAIADVNGDGKPDLLVTNRFACSSCAHGSVAVLLGNGDGTFQSAVTYDSGAMLTETIAVADVNGDGKPDIIVGNHCGCSGQIGVLLGSGDGTFQTVVGYSSIVAADKIVVSDVNGDGKPDVLVLAFCGEGICPNSDGAVTVLLGNGDGTFQVTNVVYDSGGRQAESIAVADVNGDGKPDLLVANQCTSQGCTQDHGVVGVLLGNGDGSFQPVVNYSGGNHTSGLAVADVNGDGKLDVVETDVGSGAGVLLGNGNGTFQQRVGYDTGGYTSGSIAVADVNRDGKLDLLVANETPGTVAVLLGNGDGTFQPAVIQAEIDPRSLAVADLNGNGSLDLVVGTDDGNLTPLVGVMMHIGTTLTTTTLTSSPNPSLVGQPVTFTATVSSTDGTPPNGETITFNNGSAVLGTSSLSGGTASLTTSFPQVGTFTITATYAGDATFAASTSPALQETVNAASRYATSTALASNLNPSTYGQPITFTATVTSTGGTPPNGDTVTFYNGSNVLGTASLNGGIASLTKSSLQSGIHTISATYLGDANFTASTSPGLLQVVDTAGQSPTTTTVTSSLNPSIYGQTIAWTATVTTSGSAAPTGKVNFTSNGYSFGEATVNASGVATMTKSKLNAGTYPLTAEYLGDTNNGPSPSLTLNQVITQATSTATLSSSPNPSTQGQAVTFTAKITSPTATPTGPVIFTVGKTTLGTVELTNGKATLTTSTLAVGSTTVTVTYPWNSDIAASSASVTQVVDQ
jgi:hypothetical protein